MHAHLLGDTIQYINLIGRLMCHCIVRASWVNECMLDGYDPLHDHERDSIPSISPDWEINEIDLSFAGAMIVK